MIGKCLVILWVAVQCFMETDTQCWLLTKTWGQKVGMEYRWQKENVYANVPGLSFSKCGWWATSSKVTQERLCKNANCLAYIKPRGYKCLGGGA